ncbi:hypothetical protein [Halorientalis marina]|uniref:hypothetical protein n=1 Tax=Halorientalis marina TaxID=2931976 RepID=UPI001FF5506C|nr:hypothetical protein [Halorientalis marina]
MPIYAMASAVLSIPFRIAAETIGAPAVAQTLWRNLAVGLWGYLGYLGSAYWGTSIFSDERRQYGVTILLLIFPAFWADLLHTGANVLVTALVLATILAAREQRWLLAGLALGLATFKFTALPLTVVLLGFAVATDGPRAGLLVSIGGIVSQIPNVLYFALDWNALVLIVSRRGALSYAAHVFRPEQTFLLPLQLVMNGEFYSHTVFPFVVLTFTLAGTAIAVKSDLGLIAGFPIAYFSTSYMVAAEQRTLPFYVLTVLLLAGIAHCSNRDFTWSYAFLFVVVGYWELVFLLRVHHNKATFLYSVLFDRIPYLLLLNLSKLGFAVAFVYAMWQIWRDESLPGGMFR